MREHVSFSYGTENDDFYIQHMKRTEPFERTNHYHGNYEIYFQLAGQRAYFIKDRTYLIAPGDLVFINKYDVHKTSDIGPPGHERIVINFSDAFLGPQHVLSSPFLFTPFQQAGHVIHLKLQEQLFVQGVFNKLIQELRGKATGFELYVKHLLVELLLFATRYVETHETTPVEHANPLHRKISDIVQFMNRHYAETVTLSGIAEQFYISPYYLSRAFRDVTGFTLIEYLNMTRIKEAQRLLKETNLKIIEIAGQVGYGNVAHFGRVFKQLSTITPQAYRKSSRLHDNLTKNEKAELT